MSWVDALVANALVIGALAAFALLNDLDKDLFYRSVQEDEWLEWATVWAFLLAAGFFVHNALQQRRVSGRLPWFFAGVALFCFVVAMEEISWGQRLLGYRPPPYFLEHNFQQELNVHNVIERKLRMFSVKAILLGYGVALPLLALWPAARRVLWRLGIQAPPLGLAPAFAAAYAAYEDYTWKFTGEIVELMMGLGFAFAAQAGSRGLGPAGVAAGGARLAAALAVCCGWVVALGGASAVLSRVERSSSPAALETARVELAALERDFLGEARRRRGRLPSDCGLHKRLYTYREKYDREFLLVGDFVGLTARGLPEDRAEFLLDPWNTPYWLRDICRGGSQVVFVYSFGPNRRRDSSKREIRGDDLGVVLEK